MQKKRINTKAITALLLFGGFLSLFNETILNVAFPELMKVMGVSSVTVQWLATGYMLVVGILVPITALLIHTFSTKQLFVGAMLLFLAGTIVAASAGNFQVLLAARMLQATGTGMLMPIMMNTVLSLSPPEKRGAAIGMCSCSVLFGPAFGPIVSGALLQFFSWRMLFIILIPLSVICIIVGLILLNNSSVITKPKIDYLSILLSIIGFGGIIYGISIMGDANMSRTMVMFVFAAGIIALVLYTFRQLSIKQPILEVRSFKYPMFTLGIVLIVLIQMIQFSANILLPTMLQEGFRVTSFVSAVVLLPSLLVNGFTTPIAGRIYDRYGGRVIIPLGLLIMSIFIFIISRVNLSLPVAIISFLYCFVGLGIALALSAIQTNALNQLPGRNQPDGIAIVNTAFQIGAAIGSTVFIGLMAKGQSAYINSVHGSIGMDVKVQSVIKGFSYSMTFAAAVLGIGFLLALFIRNNKRNKNIGIQEESSAS